MKLYMGSFIYRGVLGGSIALEENGVRYRTGKVSVEKWVRDFTLSYSDIKGVSYSRGIFKRVKFLMSDGKEYEFIVHGIGSFRRELEVRMNRL